MQMSGNPSAGEAARLRNPQAGTILAALAGSRREIEFDVHNDSPAVTAFRLETEGAVTEWAAGTGTDGLLVLAPSGSGTMRLRLAPPLGAAAGDYDFRVRVIASDGLVMQDTPLTLHVETPAGEAVPLVAQDTTQAGNRSVAPLPAGSVSVLPPPLPAANGPTSQDSAPSRLTGYPTTSNPSASAVAAPAAATLQEGQWTDADAPDEEPLNFITLTASETGGDETDATAETSVLDPKEGTSLPVRPGETLLVRFGFINTGVQEITYILDEDRSLPQGWAMLVQDQVNLTRNGSGEVSLRLTPPATAEPGEYPFMVMFGLQGGTLMSRTLVLAVIATPAVRLKTQQARITIRPFYQSARFALEVSSAGNADTAFRISVKRSEETQKDTPGKEARKRAGKQAVSQTAQEQVAENLDADKNRDKNQKYKNRDVYETEQWQYLFDRELDDLCAPAPNRPPQPVTIHLRLRRRGWWWLGLRETHRVRVAAVPVTEPENGGVLGNSVELTAVRWRLTPFPALFLAPLFVLMMILFAGQPGEIKADGFYYTTPNDQEPVYYVTDPPGPSSRIRFHWTAGYITDPYDTEHPAHSKSVAGSLFRWMSGNFALLKLTGFKNGIAIEDVPSFYRGPGKYSQHFSEEEGTRIGKYEFILTNSWGGGAIQRAMFYTFNTYRETPLCVTTRINHDPERTWISDERHRVWPVPTINNIKDYKNYEAQYAAAHPESVSEKLKNIQSIDLYARVHDRILLTLINLAPDTDSVNYILAKGRDTYDRNKKIIYHDEPGAYHQLEYLYLNNTGSITYRTKENPTANRMKIPIEVTDKATVGTKEELVFVTTSADFSMVKIIIHIVASPQTPGTPAASVHSTSRVTPASRGENR